MLHFFDLTPQTLGEHIAQLGMPSFRAEQLLRWVYERRICDPEQMTDLSKVDREQIAQTICFQALTQIEHQSASDGTQKLLLSIETSKPGTTSTECVMIPAQNKRGNRRTACISSQVGCPVGCRFCASGLGGLELNLTAGQIVEQVWHLNRVLADTIREDASITNIVFMGMGEPLSNFSSVVNAVRTLTAPWAFNLSARKVTISTVGVPAQIRRLADQLDLPVTLAISLHAPNDKLRRELIPWAESTSVDAILDSAEYYFQKTGREVTLEYILLGGTNDGAAEAAELASVARRLRCNINLIRYNEVRGLPYDRPATENVRRFQKILADAGINAHIRASRGRDISAACGQLRHESASKPPTAP